MPKLILRCNYLKNAPPSHLANYMNYISTREGVEKVTDTTAQLPATVKQKELIQDILNRIEDAKRMHEYYDYIQKPTRENASEFITQALENNLDLIAKKKNYMDYLANRPGVIWINVISLRREDAERLGYDSAAQWQALLRSRVQLLCENYKIDSRNLKWYTAFHNESHHPHVHLVVYSTKPSEGHLTKNGIEAMRSAFAHDIFRQEFMSIYEKKTKQRDEMKEQANKSLLFLLQQMERGVCHNWKCHSLREGERCMNQQTIITSCSQEWIKREISDMYIKRVPAPMEGAFV
ncbi:MAG: relaxase MobL [Lachnospiraceae bacterium]|nr:relaxase MobL [Lachnospiraceae bacterium]